MSAVLRRDRPTPKEQSSHRCYHHSPWWPTRFITAEPFIPPFTAQPDLCRHPGERLIVERPINIVVIAPIQAAIPALDRWLPANCQQANRQRRRWFGVLADHLDRRLQLGIGTVILVGANVVLATASTVWLTALGAALWGLQLGVTQGLLGATVADVSPDRLRGTAFGIYDVAVGVGTFAASAGAGVLWMVGGPSMAFVFSACVAVLALLMLLLRRSSQTITKPPN